jgi:hypothetical protein
MCLLEPALAGLKSGSTQERPGEGEVVYCSKVGPFWKRLRPGVYSGGGVSSTASPKRMAPSESTRV